MSRAYDDRRLVEADIRAFLKLTVQWVTSAHDEAWAAAQAEADRVFDPKSMTSTCLLTSMWTS